MNKKSIVIIVVLLIVVVAVYMFMRKQEPETTTTVTTKSGLAGLDLGGLFGNMFNKDKNTDPGAPSTSVEDEFNTEWDDDLSM